MKVRMRTGDRASALRVPVVGDQFASIMQPELIEVGGGDDAPGPALTGGLDHAEDVRHAPTKAIAQARFQRDMASREGEREGMASGVGRELEQRLVGEPPDGPAQRDQESVGSFLSSGAGQRTATWQ